MRLRFGMIASPPLQNVISEALPELEAHCDICVYVARSNEHASQLYALHWQEHDAFVFSGKVFLYSATGLPGGPRRPCYCFDDVPGNITDILLELVVGDRAFDFSRTFVDIACSVNNYLGLKQLLPPDQWPHFADEDEFLIANSMGGEEARQFTERTLRRHIALHQAGRIDLSITRFGAIIDQLEAIGLPVVYVSATKDYVVGFFAQLIASIAEVRVRAQLPGCAVIWFAEGNGEQESLMAEMEQSLQAYAARLGLDFTLQRERNRIQILTLYRDLDQMTQGFTSSGDISSLTPPGRILWGMGTGGSIFQARRNAADAVDIARRAKNGVYYISDEGKVIGPLGNSGPVYVQEPSENLLRLADIFGTDHVSLQKISAYTKLCHSVTVTAEELADFLGVTTRSASRILGKIARGGGARVYQEVPGGRGRPKNQYELLFIDHLE